MATPEEVSAWSLEEIQAEIQALLPKGSTVRVTPIPTAGYWTVQVLGPGDPDPVVELEELHTDQRIALLNLFGILWFRSLPQPSGASPWVRRRELPRPDRTFWEDVKDPEDLDPADVEMVYRPKS